MAAIGVDGNGHGAIEVSSLSGDRCGSLVVGESGGKLFLGNNEGKPFIEAGGDSDGGLMQVYDRNMKVAATIQGLGEGGRIAVGIASKGIGGSIEARGDGPAALSIPALSTADLTPSLTDQSTDRSSDQTASRRARALAGASLSASADASRWMPM